jgi:1-deoxy-D-xylulose-5-phosphate reductoisomerase
VKRIAILGSTGSIGRSAIEIVRLHLERFEVVGLSACRNRALLAEQLEIFPDARYAIGDSEGIEEIGRLAPSSEGRSTGFGEEGIKALIEESKPDMVINALVGIAGLRPTLWALEAGADVALANKETLVTAGDLVMGKARDSGRAVLPIDSEHFSLSRCLRGNREETVQVILTASGGPFYGKSRDELESVTIEEVLDHPTWRMGKKVTVDSAHLLNKGFEVMEAHHLFGFAYDAIDVVIHPQSLVHSLTRFRDGSMLAHLGPADMRLPIMNALFHPDITEFPWDVLDLAEMGKLEFHPVDRAMFPAFGLAMEAASLGGTAPAILNAADEMAVEAFLGGKIGFLDVIAWISEALENHTTAPVRDIDDIFEADKWTKEFLLKTRSEAHHR